MAKGEFSEIISSEDEQEGEEMEVPDNTEGETESSESENEEHSTTRVYLPDHRTETDQPLECDETAYICYHAVKTGSPCLSFDIIPDGLGEDRADRYPLTMTVVGGTEVKRANGNHLLVMRLSNMHKNKAKREDEEEDSESDSDDEENSEGKPVLECASIKHAGGVNRVKVTTLGEEKFAASWSELGKVHLWNLSRPLEAVRNHHVMASYIQNRENLQPTFTFAGHGHEGFAMQWSSLVPGMLATGDVNKAIHLWKPLEGGAWHVDQRPFTGHTASVEDIQWSPTESNVMASCSADKSIRIWDMRAPPHKACMLIKENAHEMDVNVISWNKSDPFILSGGDDGKLRVWDLRQFPDGAPICTFKYHTGPITSVEWHPTDHSVFAAAAEDHVVSQWDLAVERDGPEEDSDVRDLPPQLLFLHMGQKEVKEVHWHPQMPGVLASTSISGLNVFRTMSV